ncbi:MAG: hypothetical protein AB7S50_03755 [Bacteroidales bacterium]
MKVQVYKLDKAFGPVGTIAGIIIFAAGIYTLFYSLVGVVLILLGAFVGFTGTKVYIDFEERKVKQTTSLFGIFNVGHWLSISSEMKLGIKKTNLAWRTYSRSNRTIESEGKNYGIYLYESKGKEIMPLYKAETQAEVNAEIENLSAKLRIEQF